MWLITASPAEVARIAGHMPPQYPAAVTLAAWSGLRFGELFALARRHVDLDAGTVRVERALEQVPGKPITFGKPKTDKSRRLVHLPGFVLAALREHMAEHVEAAPDALLFPKINAYQHGQNITPRHPHAHDSPVIPDVLPCGSLAAAHSPPRPPTNHQVRY